MNVFFIFILYAYTSFAATSGRETPHDNFYISVINHPSPEQSWIGGTVVKGSAGAKKLAEDPIAQAALRLVRERGASLTQPAWELSQTEDILHVTYLKDKLFYPGPSTSQWLYTVYTFSGKTTAELLSKVTRTLGTLPEALKEEILRFE